jgi:hypothetical protein
VTVGTMAILLVGCCVRWGHLRLRGSWLWDEEKRREGGDFSGVEAWAEGIPHL